MIRALWLKRIWRGHSKGISSVIGIVFLILVIFAVATNIFIWTISQSVMYNQIAKDTNQKNADRVNENIIAIQGNYTVLSGDKVKVETKLTNAGSVAAQIINLWVFDTSKQTYGFNNSVASMNLNLNPGEVLDLTGMNIITVTVPQASSLDGFVSWFVTGRGNVVPVETAPPLEPEHLPISATGYFSLDWFYLKYTARYQTQPIDAAVISKQRRYVAFWINVTNNGDEAMTVKSTSLIMLLIEWQEPLFYIVGSLSYSGTPTITPYDDGNPITIGPHQSQILTFAAKSTVQSTTWSWGSSLPVGIQSGSTPEGAVVMTALVYTMQSHPTIVYAQSLSFRALVLGP